MNAKSDYFQCWMFRYGFALRAHDANDNVAPPSNVASLTFVREFPVEELPIEVTTESPGKASMLSAAKFSILICLIIALSNVY